MDLFVNLDSDLSVMPFLSALHSQSIPINMTNNPQLSADARHKCKLVNPKHNKSPSEVLCSFSFLISHWNIGASIVNHSTLADCLLMESAERDGSQPLAGGCSRRQRLPCLHTWWSLSSPRIVHELFFSACAAVNQARSRSMDSAGYSPCYCPLA